MELLDVSGLCVSFDTDEETVDVLDSVDLRITEGETHGIVGESGCGKSVTSFAIMGLLPKPSGKITGGQILFRGQDLVSLTSAELRSVRGDGISMIFQEPMAALNPVQRVGHQLLESLRIHQPKLSADECRRQCVEMLDRVGIPAPDQRMNEHPHQLSGGMRQRVMIAMALVNVPDVLIADEPTTALDVTIQAQILELLKELQREYGMAVIFITHDLAVIAEISKNVTVMYAGRVVERASVVKLFESPRHPYTQGLLSSIPSLEGTPKTELATIPGMVPTFSSMPSGCRFSNRCEHVRDVCTSKAPTIEDTGAGHSVACVRWRQLLETGT